jgi:hypothetical protein
VYRSYRDKKVVGVFVRFRAPAFSPQEKSEIEEWLHTDNHREERQRPL